MNAAEAASPYAAATNSAIADATAADASDAAHALGPSGGPRGSFCASLYSWMGKEFARRG